MLRASVVCWGRAAYTSKASVPHLEVPKASQGHHLACSLVLSGSSRGQKLKKKTCRKSRVVFLRARSPPITGGFSAAVLRECPGSAAFLSCC